MVGVTFENKAVVKNLKDLRKNVLKDTANAINRAANASRKRVDKEFSSITGAKLTRVKRLSKVAARARAFGAIRMFAIIRWGGKKLPVYSLAKGKVKPSGSGSNVKLKSGTRFFPGAFKMTANSGRYVGLFKRKDKRRRAPITEIKMDSNPDLFRDRGIGDAEEKKAVNEVNKFYDVAVAKRLANFNKRV